jgi:hypothetical protein
VEIGPPSRPFGSQISLRPWKGVNTNANAALAKKNANMNASRHHRQGLTYAELRRRATTDGKPMNGPSGLKAFMWMLIVSIIVLLGIAIVGWIIES